MTGTLLILPGGAEAAHVARRAKELGLYVVVADSDPGAPGFAYSDSRLIANGYSGEETGAAAERFNRKVKRIDGLVSVASGSAGALGAVSARLRLPGLSRRSAQLLTDRLALKQRLRDTGVPVNWFAEVFTPQELARVAVERGHELLIFPAEGNASTAQRVSAGKNLNEAFALAQSGSTTGGVMVEQRLQGRTLWSASLVMEGQCVTLALADCAAEQPDALLPFAIAGDADLPGALTSDEREQINELIAKSASALGIGDGPVECFIVVNQGAPHIVDVAAKLSGTLISLRGIMLSSGVDYAAAVIRLALGERIARPELEPVRAAPVVQRSLFAPAGRVVTVDGVETARGMPGIADVEFELQPGAAVEAGTGNSTPAVTLLATGDTHTAAAAAARDALASIRIEVEPA